MDIFSYLLGKKAGGGGGEAVLINKSISANGTYNASSDNADGYKKVEVSVPASAVDTGTKPITSNGNGQDVVGYAAVDVAVPNSYGAGDEGKVVDNGTLVSQSSASYTSNGTYDTTLVNEVEVDVAGVPDYSSILMGANQNGTLTLPGVTKLRSNLFLNVGGSYSVESSDILEIQDYCFDNSSGLIGLRVPNCASIGAYAIRKTHQEVLFAPSALLSPNCANGNTYIKTAVIGGMPSNSGNFQFRNASAFKTADVAGGGRFDNTFNGCTAFDTLILRNTTLVSLFNIDTFTGTCFASGGAGGTLYVPNDLISDYQGASNWSTILGYANNQIKSIESTHTDPSAPIDLTLYYADGTPIS